MIHTVPKVALLIETSNAYARGLLRGIEDYIHAHGPWSVCLAEHGRGDRPPGWLSKWNGQGVIARIENRNIATALATLKIPVVDVSAARLLPELPWVETDDRAIADLAAEHFLERGFRTFAFCGDTRFKWSDARSERFAGALRAQGFPCHVFEQARGSIPADEEVDLIAAWLTRLPKPVAVFACYDARGQQVLDACGRADLVVPEQVAILGVDNDEILCELSSPPLSSVIPNTRRTGWQAAELLGRMMKGEPCEVGGAHLIPPLGIAIRQSTDVTAVADPHVGKAAQFIRENACRGIGVAEVLRAVPVARRDLERRFRSLLGCTLKDEICRVQIQRVKELLTGTDLSLAEISERTGFRHVEYLTVVFKREVGLPPSVYRQQQLPGRRRGMPGRA